MKDCKDIFEWYREAIHVEYMLKWYCMQKAKSQKITKAQVVEPMAKDIKRDIEKQKHEKKEFTTNLNDTTYRALNMDGA